METNELSVDDKIKTLLLFFGITESVEIEEDAKEMILLALSQDDVEKVYIDKDNGLCIDYSGEK